MMRFIVWQQSIYSQIPTEELVNESIFKQKIFPEEYLRQLYEIAVKYVEEEYIN